MSQYHRSRIEIQGALDHFSGMYLSAADGSGVMSVEDGNGHILPEQQGAIDLAEIQCLAASILEGEKCF